MMGTRNRRSWMAPVVVDRPRSTPRKKRAVLVLGALFVLIAFESRAEAQSVPLVVVTSAPRGTPAATDADLSALARGASGQLVLGPALVTQLQERYGAPDASGDTLREVRERVPRSRRQYNEALSTSHEADTRPALQSLERDADLLLAQPEALDRMRENREALISALLFVANVTVTSEPSRSAEAIRKLVEALPDLTLTARVAGESVRNAYREQVRQLATASLVVQSVPDSCQVRRNGIFLGNAPAQLQGLVPGTHRIAIRCGGRLSLVHRVSVGAGTTSTVQIDMGLDRALELGTSPTLRYENVGQLEARMIGDVSVLGSALGADRVVVFRPEGRRLVVVDVIARTVVREVNEREWSDLPRVLRARSTGTTTATAREATALPEVRVRVRPRTAPTALAPVRVTNAAPNGPQLLFGIVFGASGLVLAGGGTAAWFGADIVRSRSLTIGDEGSVLGGIRSSGASGETALRSLAVGGWIAGGALLVAGTSLFVLGATRREPSLPTVRAAWTGQGITVFGAF